MTDINATSEQRRHYLAPGVYRQPRATPRPDLRLVRTDVTGFIGYAERGPLVTDPHGVKGLLPAASEVYGDVRRVAVRVTSWKEYRAVFGGFTDYAAMPYAVRGFFENGGTTCYVVRVAATHHPETRQRPRFASVGIPAANSAEPIHSALARLAKRAEKGDLDLFLESPFVIAEGQLLRITAQAAEGELVEFGMVVNQQAAQIRLTRPLSVRIEQEQVTLTRLQPALVVTATSSGNWGNRIVVTVTPLVSAGGGDEFALRVFLQRDLAQSPDNEEEFYRRLSLDPGSQYYAENLINGFSKLIRVEVSSTTRSNDRDSSALPPRNTAGRGVLRHNLRPLSFRLVGGQDGLSGVTPKDFTGGPTDMRGLRLFEDIDEVAIVSAADVVYEQLAPPAPPAPAQDPCNPKEEVIGDLALEDETAVPPTLSETDVVETYRAIIEQCERLRDRVAILDTPKPPRTADELKRWRDNFITRFAALYYPWLKVPDARSTAGQTRLLPPSGYVAGIYARIDNQFGVHHPPANAALKYVTDVAEDISTAAQEDLNPFGINAIRAFAGRGIRVWGARSLADTKTDGDWRFIHVRRVMSMIEESVDESMQWAVFEPNDETLRRTLVHSLSVFLETIWRQGGLKGAVPAEGFFVKCDETNNPPAVVESGQLVCQIGVAVAAPMEFIIFEMRQQPGGTQIVEP
jgi:uncharacterized protein